MLRIRRPIPHRAKDPGIRLPAAGLVSDWLESLKEEDLDHETWLRLEAWCVWLKLGGQPPEPLPLDATEKQIEQALRSFMRNVYRGARLQSDARVHDLKSCVTDLITGITDQSHAIGRVREEIHTMLHQIEDALPDSSVVTETASAIRKALREIHHDARRTRNDLNERLQEMRSAILTDTTSDIVESESEREANFRKLRAAALLFGENLCIIHVAIKADDPATTVVARSARSVFRRATDVVCCVQQAVSVLAIDTPERHARQRALATLSTLPDAVAETCSIQIAAEAEKEATVEEALSRATPVHVADNEDSSPHL